MKQKQKTVEVRVEEKKLNEVMHFYKSGSLFHTVYKHPLNTASDG
jgi:hypothetical protein